MDDDNKPDKCVVLFSYIKLTAARASSWSFLFSCAIFGGKLLLGKITVSEYFFFGLVFVEAVAEGSAWRTRAVDEKCRGPRWIAVSALLSCLLQWQEPESFIVTVVNTGKLYVQADSKSNKKRLR